MAVSKYEKDGKIFWQAYVGFQSTKNLRVRVQKRVRGIETERQAQVEEKRLIKELSEKLTKEEAKDSTWEEVIDRWVCQQEMFPTRRIAETTLLDYESLLKNWTKPWLSRIASELNRADGREVLRFAEENGRKRDFRKKLKNTINMVFEWGIEEKIINGVHHSPVYGLEIDPDREEKKPEILTASEIRDLLRKAQEQDHPWYHIWVAAVLTGCRSGELHELKKGDLEIISRDQALDTGETSPSQANSTGFLSTISRLKVRTQTNTCSLDSGSGIKANKQES